MYNVLIVDDEPLIIEGLSIMLDWEAYGFTVAGLAENGREALERLKERRYSLVITDIRMPVLDGLDLIKAIRAQNPSTRILIISGYNEFSYAKQAIEYGVKGYLLKPINREELTDYLTAVKKELDQEFNDRLISRQNTGIARDKLLYDLVTGSLGEKNARESMVHFDVDLNAETYGVALVEIDGLHAALEKSLEDARLLRFSVRNIVEEIVAEEKLGFVYEEVEGMLGVLLCCRHTVTPDEVVDCLEKIRKCVHTYLKANVTIGVGDICTGLSDVKQARVQAGQALERKRSLSQEGGVVSGHIIDQIKTYIDRNYQEDLSLKSLAGIFYMNPAYLGQLFKNAFGETFNDYLNKVRISEAKRMILVENGRIYEIIDKVGYKNPEYFYRQFKRYEGVSFAEYKESMRKV